jgi:VanZ family protein
MGRRDVRVIAVPKFVTVILLLLISAAMAALIYGLSGRAYANESQPIRNLLMHVLHADYHSVPRDSVLAVLMPVIANILLFIPWGFLAFVALDGPSRPRRRTYALTVLGGVIFAAAIELWQFTLPTRITTATDSIANGFGALTGAILGHLRKQVRVRFEY